MITTIRNVGHYIYYQGEESGREVEQSTSPSNGLGKIAGRLEYAVKPSYFNA